MNISCGFLVKRGTPHKQDESEFSISSYFCVNAIFIRYVLIYSIMALLEVDKPLFKFKVSK